MYEFPILEIFVCEHCLFRVSVINFAVLTWHNDLSLSNWQFIIRNGHLFGRRPIQDFWFEENARVFVPNARQ